MIYRFFAAWTAFFLLIGAKLPEIKESDVTAILEQIMQSHASHKELSTPLVKRAVDSFLEELDPTKCYFLQAEVEKWVVEDFTPVLEAVNRSDFSLFQEIQQQMITAIERRNTLEEKLDLLPPAKNVSVDEFKELAWASSEEELLDRLMKNASLV